MRPKTFDLKFEELAQKGKQLRESVASWRQEVREIVQTVRERDPASRSDMEVLLLYSGVHALLLHRVAHRLYQKERFLRHAPSANLEDP